MNISEGKKKDGFATAPGAMRQGHTSLPGTSRIFFTFQTSNGRKLAVEAKRIEALLSTTFHFLAAMSSDSQRHTLQVDENSPTKVRQAQVDSESLYHLVLCKESRPALLGFLDFLQPEPKTVPPCHEAMR